MKTRISNGFVLFSAMLLLAVPGWSQGWANRGAQAPGRNSDTCIALGLPMQDLNAAEAAALIFLREEEKLARDVYLHLYTTWDLPIFGRIALSEQRHMQAVKSLLDRYGLSDPAADNAEGVFTDPELQVLYRELISEGQSSAAAALRVGATIEDLDISDLDKALGVTDNDDLKMVFENLQLGSRNHLRAFVAQLEYLGETYTAQYIDPAVLEEILATPRESGVRNGTAGSGRGNGLCDNPPLGSNAGLKRP